MRAIPRVLAVVPDALFRATLCDKLRGLEMSITAVPGSRAGVGVLSEQEIDVVLVDVRHGDEEAGEILTAMKESRSFSEVILLNSSNNVGAAIESMRSGAADEFVEPFDLGTLRKKIEAACVRKKKKEKRKRSIWNILEDAMVAATFAQAGDFETAREISRGEEDQEKSSPAPKPTEKPSREI